jgi:hypothetical protein
LAKPDNSIIANQNRSSTLTAIASHADRMRGIMKASNQEDKNMSDAQQAPQARDIIDAIREIWRKGNASHLDIEKEGKTVLSISLTVGTIGLLLAPVAALIGIGAALITEYTINITLDNGTVINVNEFAVSHKKAAEHEAQKDTKDENNPD